MTVVVKVEFDKFLRMKDHYHTRFQLYYVETETKFKMFMFFPDFAYYTSILKGDIAARDRSVLEGGRPLSEIEIEFKMNAFRQTYLSDGINVSEVLLPSNLKVFDEEVKKKETPENR